MKARWMCALALAALVAGCGGEGGGDDDTLLIGTSLPLTGEDSQLGVSTQRGYKAWEKVVNDRGGILGREVKLKILDDNTNQNTVISDYNALISRHNVDFVMGTFSTRLTLPALGVVERHRKLYLDPAGQAPEVLARGYELYFYTENSAVTKFGVPFANHIVALPPDKRPKSVAYVLTEDPFTTSTVEGMKRILEKAGIKTVVRATYPFGARNFGPIASRVAQADPDLLVTAGGFDDEVGIMRAINTAGAKPRILYQTNAPSERTDFPKAVGIENTEGVFWPSGYTAALRSHGNKEFVKAYRGLYPKSPEPTGLAAFAYTAGQVLEAALKAVGEKGIENQQLLADWLHANAVETVIGKMSWDERGDPQGQTSMGQWQDGKAQIVSPKELATTDRILPCWRAC